MLNKEEIIAKRYYFKHSGAKMGFTLAELLIVVAIIAVLVAIAIPIFSTLLERSRESTDAANIRSAYAALLVDALSNDSQPIPSYMDIGGVEGVPSGTYKVLYATEVTLKQTRPGWQNEEMLKDLADTITDKRYDATGLLQEVDEDMAVYLFWVSAENDSDFSDVCLVLVGEAHDPSGNSGSGGSGRYHSSPPEDFPKSLNESDAEDIGRVNNLESADKTLGKVYKVKDSGRDEYYTSDGQEWYRWSGGLGWRHPSEQWGYKWSAEDNNWVITGEVH